jgi:hypothetical protein
MKVLAAGGTSLVDMQRNSGPVRFTSRIVGVAADRERLYVLHWQGGERQPSCSLLVFRPDSGVLIHSLELTGDDVPKEEPKETTDRGPLRLRPDGVACFGARFEFKGTELLKPPGEKKP